MQSKHIANLLIAPAILIAIASGQKPALGQDAGWQTLRPEGEEFSVSIPKSATSETTDETFHRMPMNARWYISTSDKGPIFAVVSLSGIKSNPAAYTEAQRLNSYVDAFKTLFPPRVRGKEAVAKLVVVGDKNLNGNAGREYRITLGDLSGSVYAFATRRRFYAVTILNTKKDDAITEKFLTSFYLPERQVEVSTAAVAEKPQTLENPANPNEAKKSKTEDEQRNDASAEGDAKPAEAGGAATPLRPEKNDKPEKPGEKGPINGGVLNGKALFLPKPDYPAEAKAAGAHGTVSVQVVVDEYGNVMSAKALNGHPSLQQACVNAALAARFSQTTLMGEPVKVSGILTYNFVQ